VNKERQLFNDSITRLKMSESESDPDLTVSRYEEEDNPNYYGSPVYEEHTPVEPEANQLALPTTVECNTIDNRTQVSDSFSFTGFSMFLYMQD
jgi:hypothetical protein